MVSDLAAAFELNGVSDWIILAYIIFASAAFMLAALLAERHYRALSMLPAGKFPGAAPSVAVLIPARDEAANIERVVGTLSTQDYPNFTVTVIDDHSSDATASLAEAAGAAVLRLTSEPPPGWTGKCNACEQGARASSADWLLFADADTAHTPGSLSAAIAYAEAHGLDALSLLLQQECQTFWERLILPLAYQQFFAVLRPAAPAFNGQYILIRRAVYERSGGFGAVRGRVMEDVALAERLAALNCRVALLNAGAFASVRMYRNFPALLRGMSKTAFTAARDRGLAGWLLGGLTFLGMFTFLLITYGLLTKSPLAILGYACIILTLSVGLRPWVRRFGVPPGYSALGLLGLVVLWAIGMVSTFRVLGGAGVRWKGRTIVEQRL